MIFFLKRVVFFGALTTVVGLVHYLFKAPNTKKIKRHKRRFWMRPIYQKRVAQGFYHNLIAELRLNDPILFFNFTRMSAGSFEKLLQMCAPFLIKHSQRESLEPGFRLMVTLRFLATGDSYPSLVYSFRIHPSTVCKIIKETCDIIWHLLQPKPLTERDWLKIAHDFYVLWQLANCLGAIDGKHVRIRAPANSGSTFFNYKKYFSLIILAICDAKCNFTYVDIGSYGAQSDGGVLRNSSFGRKLAEGKLNIPQQNILPGTDISVPLFLVGDEAFPLHLNLMRPFSKRRDTQMPEEERIFNYRLSRARRTIENAFGIMVARFRILLREIKAIVCLHNFIKKENSDMYCYPNFIDREENGVVIPGEWRREVGDGLGALESTNLRFGARNASKSAWEFRNFIKDYLNSIGAHDCPWQYDHIRRTN